MTWVSFWGGWIFMRPGVIVTFAFLITLWHGVGSGRTVEAGCCVILLLCGGSGLCYNHGSWAGVGVMVFVTQLCWRCPLVVLVLLFLLLQVVGWGWMGLGSVGILWGHLPRLLPHLQGKGLGITCAMGVVLCCRRLVPMMSWVYTI